ncbi:MAG TPA: malectin domain-containing carbohydrate-binding protein [Sunxiuqinia sp.]|nr:malectin domain-containing carbohydrate-binding protein [Sunxiuqinia sp.]
MYKNTDTEMFQYRKYYAIAVLLLIFLVACQQSGEKVRQDISLDSSWQTAENDTDQSAFRGFQKSGFDDQTWETVDVPHNWDDYGGYRRLKHGNRHGYAWYRKTFTLQHPQVGKKYFLWFEGVGSYATVWLNGDSIGYHAGGRTSFTLDATKAIHLDGENVLAVRADHPANIRDLPWVCGGCSPEWGFSEGSQPMGIFRPVHLIVTAPVRVQPFGVHIWNDNHISAKSASLNLTTEVKNYELQEKTIRVVNELKDANGNSIKKTESTSTLAVDQIDTITQQFLNIENPHLWSLDDPYLYTVETSVYENDQLVDQTETQYGIRWIEWDIHQKGATDRFYLNGKPVFINGTAEYEHLLGQSHAFSKQQIDARIAQVRAAGFNAFRDAHQPHNLHYKQLIDSLGLLWWPQMAAHIWFDTPEFRANFKQLLTDWIRERRNSPSVILWGLENESTLPTDFAKECADLIRKLDPTASSQRLITTCNGGTGTDWNVIQNWSGTYGGDPYNYDKELSRQLLNGEYGAWRSIDFHTEGGFDQNGPLSEDRFSLLMETKVRLAEAARDSVCGQFFWLLASHDNPGRVQSGEGLRDLDRVGPVNYKGAFTIWDEPLDVFYMFRSNYVSPKTHPMVYIVSHTWPDRWVKAGIKNGINVFSNCDEVELFNGVREHSFGRKKRGGIGTHFTWNNVDVENNVLYAVGYVDDKEVAHDYIVLNHLPKADKLESLSGHIQPLTQDTNRNYVYLVNCGGSEYKDSQGNVWMADRHQTSDDTWGSRSWTDDYKGLPAFYASQRQTHDPIAGTLDWPLIQTFRYGRHKLNFNFPVSDGLYQVDLYFNEPWYGTGGGLDCTGWRLFDVAVNDDVKIHNLDIWKEVGHDHLLKKTLKVHVTGGKLKISFPKVNASQAVISAIAISIDKKDIKPAPSPAHLIQPVDNTGNWKVKTWMNTGDNCYSDAVDQFVSLPSKLYGTEWIQTSKASKNNHLTFRLNADADVYVAVPDSTQEISGYTKSSQTMQTSLNGGTKYTVWQQRFKGGAIVKILLSPAMAWQHPTPIVAAVPVTKLDASIDLRPTIRFGADDANGIGRTKAMNFAKKESQLVPGKSDAVEWKFSVGLASKYGLEIRYFNPTGKTLTAEMTIRSLDGTLVWQGPMQFRYYGDKWQSLRTDTQTTINAGTYHLRLTLKEKGPLYFNFLKIQ